jgi:beta-glucosidase
MSTAREFPAGFLWGAATAAYQIEGAPLEDGAGPSIWQRFTHTPGLTAGGDTGDVACDHYHRYQDDVALMRALGLRAYRFSISWSRVLPQGKGSANQRGIDFYRRLVDALVAANIRPVATLYHWDLPAALDDLGGWLNRDIAGWFADYASLMFKSLDGVAMWATLNEPWVVTDGGYLHGALAPGHRNLFEAPLASHNLLRAHGRAVKAYRAFGLANPIGIVVNLEPKVPASTSDDDLAATARADAYMNRQYLDPIFFGEYPAALAEMFGEAWPSFPSVDFDDIRAPLDFVGINYYKRGVTRHDPRKVVERASGVRQPRSTHTETDWEVHAPGLTDILFWFRERYGAMPLYITENGAAFYDPPSAPASGEVDDPLRVDYLRQHIGALHDALRQGVDVRGYFVWSLLDNLEWSLGFSKRFGIVHVDFHTLQRTPKNSARFYSQVIATNGAAIDQR